METEKLKQLPVQKSFFEVNELVYAPTGDKMIVIDSSFGQELIDQIWVPKVRLAFIKKDNTINRKRNHRIFSQDRLIKTP